MKLMDHFFKDMKIEEKLVKKRKEVVGMEGGQNRIMEDEYDKNAFYSCTKVSA